MQSLEPTLLRAIGRWALTAAVINSVIGSGIFGMPAPLAGLLGASSPIAVLIAGASIFLIVLCFAEVGSRFDQAGGPYLYARTAFGAATGFQVGWLHVWTRLLTAAAVLNVFIAYLAPLLPIVEHGLGRAIAMSVAMGMVTIINVRGVKQTAWTINLFTVAKLLPLIAVAVLGLLSFDREVLATQTVVVPKWTDAILLLVFAYGGFESAVIAASETRDPRRDTPFALVAAMLAITLLYAVVQLAVVGVVPNAAEQKAVIGVTLGTLIGPAGAVLGSVAVLVSVYGWLVGYALMTPRIIYAMAQRGELPRFLGGVHASFRTPAAAIILNSVIGLALGLISNFAQLATFSAITRLGIYLVTCAALIRLRRRETVPASVQMPGGVLIAVAGVVFCVWLLSTREVAQAWLLPLVVLVGYGVWRGGSDFPVAGSPRNLSND